MDFLTNASQRVFWSFLFRSNQNQEHMNCRDFVTLFQRTCWLGRRAVLGAVLLLSSWVNAQTVSIGTGTATTTSAPINSCWGYSYNQMIYSQALVNTAGTIEKIRFWYVSGSGANSLNWTIYMGETAQSTFATTTSWVPTGSMTQVFSGNVTYPVATGWMEVTLSTPFAYTNVNNLVIAVDENTPNYTCSITWGSFTGAANTVMYYRNDATNPDPTAPPTASGRVTTLPRIQLDFQQPPCMDPMAGGTAEATVSSACGSIASSTLSVTGSTGASGLSYQWFSGDPGGPWDTPLGTAATQVVNNLSTSTGYVRRMTCSNDMSEAFSTEVVLTVNPNPVVTITPSGAVGSCAGATLTGGGAATYTWAPSGAVSATSGPSTNTTATTRTTYTATGTSAAGCVGTATITLPTLNAAADVSNFCGTGGTAVITASVDGSTDYDFTFSVLEGGATLANQTANSVEVTLAQTSAVNVTATGTGPNVGCDFSSPVSIGVYPLPSATMSFDADEQCPGATITVNSGLSSGNFSSASIAHAPLTAPGGAVTLANAGSALVTLTGGTLDDGGWGAVPIGFGFNFLGTVYNTINVGTNGTLMFGAFNNNSGFTTPYGLSDFSFTTLPSSGEPFNMVAVLAMDNDLSGATGGTLRYWTEGYAPNRRFVVSYENVKEFGDTRFSTAQAIFYETLGTIEVHVTSSTNQDRNKLTGLNNGDGTIGVLAFASGTSAAANNPIITPFAYRFSPPSNYDTEWSSGQMGTNIFSIMDTPAGDETYTLVYTNQLTNCSNASDPASIDYTEGAGITEASITAPSTSICTGGSVLLTAASDGVGPYSYQWTGPSGLEGTDPTQEADEVGDWYVTISDACGGPSVQSDPVSITAAGFETCYCIPATSGLGSPCFTNVTFGATLVDNSTDCLSPYYTSFAGGPPNTTGTFAAGQTYPFSFTGTTAGIVSVWIDFDHSGTFDTDEHWQPATNAASGSINITIPVDALAGSTGMRVRSRGTGSPNGPGDACTDFFSGELHDYVITITVCTPPVAAFDAPSEPCGATFTPSVTVSDPGSASTITIHWAVNGVAQTDVTYTGPNTPLGSTSVGSIVTGYITSDDFCEVDLGTLVSPCPIPLVCEDPALNYTYCYDNLDPFALTFTNPGGTVSLKIISGEFQDGVDFVQFFEGDESLSNYHGATPFLTGVLTPNQIITSTTETLSINFFEDGDGTNCAAGSAGTAPFVFQVRCGGCIEAAAEVVNDIGSGPEVDCGAPPFGQYDAYIRVFDMGIDGNTGLPPTSLSYQVTVNNGTPLAPVVGGITSVGDTPIGSYALGDVIDVTILAAQSACDVQIVDDYTVPQSLCPPENDACASPQTLSVLTPGSCGAVPGRTFGAGMDGARPSCFTTEDVLDVWYSVNTVGFASLQLLITDGTATTVGAELFTACGVAYSPALCTADATTGTVNINGIPEGDYLIRVFTTAANAGTFDICVTGLPPIGTNCAFTSSPALTIPEGDCNFEDLVVSDIIAVPSQGANVVLDMNVYVDIDHAYPNDLVLELISPLGTTVELMANPPCNDLSPNVELEFDDTAPNPSINCPAVGYAVVPSDALSAFTYEDPTGNWTLRVTDVYDCGDGGTINSWCLIPTFGVPDCIPPTANVSAVCDGASGVGVVVNVTDLGSNNTPIDILINSVSVGTITSVPYSNTFTGYTGTVSVLLANGQSFTECDLVFNGLTRPTLCNESCAGALPVAVAENEGACVVTNVVSGSTQDGSDAIETCSTVSNPSDDVWYSFVAPTDGSKVVISTTGGTSTDWVMEVYDACGSSALFCSDDVNGLMPEINLCQFQYTPGATYLIRMWTYGTNTGATCTMCIYKDVACPVPPANDDCVNAQSITIGAPGSCPVSEVSGTTAESTPAPGVANPSCHNFATYNDVWYTVTPAPGVTSIQVTLNGGSNRAAVYSGLTCGVGGTQIFCQAGPFTNSLVSVTPGQTYYIRVWANTGVTGPFTLCLQQPPPPPANDLCDNAIAVSCNSVTVASTANSTITGAPANCNGLAINTAGGIWYTVAGFDGPMTVDLSGSGFDTKVAVFTGSCSGLNCVDSDDDDGPGTTSLLTWTGSSAETYYIYVTGFSTNTGSVTMGVLCGSTDPSCATNGLNLEFQNDANPGEVTWTVLDESGVYTILSGADPIPANSIGTQAICLPDGCYRLRVNDSAGDGMTTGGYELRTSGMGQRIIDNTNNFSSGSVSAIANGGSFCLPIGTDKLIYSSCDKLDWVNNKFIVASANPTVSAQFGVSNTTSGYEFWFFDPNGTYSYRRFRSHATSDGFGSGATRACHFKVNGWVNSVATPHLPANVLLNVRVRGRVAGNNLEFGPACQFKIDAVLAACPRVKLQDDPANTSDFSCGVSRNFGGPSSVGNRIYANPPQPIPVVASNMVRYQFRFRIPGENICIVRPPQTSARMVLNWTTGTPLECSKTYEVDVRVSLDGGATWCFGPAGTSQAAACADTEDWGKVCNVTINPCANVNGGSSSMVVEGNSTFTMYPNPNRGDQLFMSVTNVEEGVNTVSVDIFDMTGKRVMARTIAVQDGFVNTNLELNGDLAGGLYMVNITAGTKAYTERLVIQP